MESADERKIATIKRQCYCNTCCRHIKYVRLKESSNLTLSERHRELLPLLNHRIGRSNLVGFTKPAGYANLFVIIRSHFAVWNNIYHESAYKVSSPHNFNKKTFTFQLLAMFVMLPFTFAQHLSPKKTCSRIWEFNQKYDARACLVFVLPFVTGVLIACMAFRFWLALLIVSTAR